MSAAKHTPGPWNAHGTNVTGGRDDIEFVCATNLSGTDCDEEPLANAKLIAAAPDLLEALRLVWDTYGLDPSIDSSIWQTVRAALAKAGA